ncbi:hypothetical protein QQ045_012220 [Rhodiola kirilowii]
MGDLTSQQISRIDALHSKTVQEENRLTTQLASLQEDMGDYLLVSVVIQCPGQIADMSDIILEAIDVHEKSLVAVLECADELRMRDFIKELLLAFSPKQGVDFLAARKKLHLSLHEWGKIKDREHGRNGV